MPPLGATDCSTIFSYLCCFSLDYSLDHCWIRNGCICNLQRPFPIFGPYNISFLSTLLAPRPRQKMKKLARKLASLAVNGATTYNYCPLLHFSRSRVGRRPPFWVSFWAFCPITCNQFSISPNGPTSRA